MFSVPAHCHTNLCTPINTTIHSKPVRKPKLTQLLWCDQNILKKIGPDFVLLGSLFFFISLPLKGPSHRKEPPTSDCLMTNGCWPHQYQNWKMLHSSVALWFQNHLYFQEEINNAKEARRNRWGFFIPSIHYCHFSKPKINSCSLLEMILKRTFSKAVSFPLINQISLHYIF